MCDRDQPLTPGRVHRVDQWGDALVDSRDADTERLGRLAAAVGEALRLVDLPQLAGCRPANLRPALVLLPPPLTATTLRSCGHRRRSPGAGRRGRCAAGSRSALAWPPVGRGSRRAVSDRVNASRPRACGSVRSQRPLARGDARHREPSRGRSFPGLAGRLHCRPVSTSRTSTTVSQARAKGGRSRWSTQPVLSTPKRRSPGARCRTQA